MQPGTKHPKGESLLEQQDFISRFHNHCFFYFIYSYEFTSYHFPLSCLQSHQFSSYHQPLYLPHIPTVSFPPLLHHSILSPLSPYIHSIVSPCVMFIISIPSSLNSPIMYVPLSLVPCQNLIHLSNIISIASPYCHLK